MILLRMLASKLQGPTGSIVTSNLIIQLDASGYSGSGSTWNNLVSGNYNFTLNNSPTFETHKGQPCFSFSGYTGSAATSSSASFSGNLLDNIVNAGTIILIVASVGNNANFGPSNGVPRLFSINDGTTNNVDYSQYMCLAMHEGSSLNRAGLFIGVNPIVAPFTQLVTANDDYKMITYTWEKAPSQSDPTVRLAKAYINSTLDMSASGYRSINNGNIQKISLAANACGIEFSKVRLPLFLMYNRALTQEEIQQNYDFYKARFGL